jgi:hypothetical protein
MVSSAHFMEWKENYKKLILENNWEIESKVLKAIIKHAAN